MLMIKTQSTSAWTILVHRTTTNLVHRWWWSWLSIRPWRVHQSSELQSASGYSSILQAQLNTCWHWSEAQRMTPALRTSSRLWEPSAHSFQWWRWAYDSSVPEWLQVIHIAESFHCQCQSRGSDSSQNITGESSNRALNCWSTGTEASWSMLLQSMEVP